MLLAFIKPDARLMIDDRGGSKTLRWSVVAQAEPNAVDKPVAVPVSELTTPPLMVCRGEQAIGGRLVAGLCFMQQFV